MKLKYKNDKTYSFTIKESDGLFNRVDATIELPFDFFINIEHLKSSEVKKQSMVNDCHINIFLENKANNDINKDVEIISLTGKQIKIQIDDDQCFLGFASCGIPLNLCLKIENIKEHSDMQIERALINSTTFISR